MALWMGSEFMACDTLIGFVESDFGCIIYFDKTMQSNRTGPPVSLRNLLQLLFLRSLCSQENRQLHFTP